MNVQWYGLVVSVVMLGFLAVAFALLIRWQKSRSELRLREFEIRHRVFEKFSDSKEFLEFARSEEGRRLLLAVPDAARSPRRAWLGLLSVGLLVLALGVGAKIAAAGVTDSQQMWERVEKHNLSTWGTLSLCAGIALTASGALSRWLERR